MFTGKYLVITIILVHTTTMVAAGNNGETFNKIPETIGSATYTWHDEEDTVNCTIFSLTSTKQLADGDYEEKEAWTIKMEIPITLVKELVASSLKLSCFPNCSELTTGCNAVVIMLENSDGHRDELNALITLVVSLESEGWLRCLGTPSFFESHRSPDINYKVEDSKAVLSCSIFKATTAEYQNHGKKFWKYILYGGLALFTIIVICGAFIVSKIRRQRNTDSG